MQSHWQPASGSECPNRLLGQWSDTALGILYVVEGEVQFADDHDHFKNGFCRLLEITDEKARQLVEVIVAASIEKHGRLFSRLTDEQRLGCTAEGVTRCLYGGNRVMPGRLMESWGTDFEDEHADTIFAGSISGDPARLVVGNAGSELAWLVHSTTNRAVTADKTVYDTDYYNSANRAHCGYTHYMAHADWRLEKAARLARTVIENSGYRKQKWLDHPGAVKVLDVGAGIGYMRKAFADYGFEHYGTELSAQIIEAARQRFGYDTWSGGVDSIADCARGLKFDIITLWDVIEHLGDPTGACRLLKDYLTSDGLLVVRTPNLMAVEAALLGDYYYSFKLDHLFYFSAKSLTKLMDKLGLQPVYVETVSHLFRGLLGSNFLFMLGRQMRGADILATYGW